MALTIGAVLLAAFLVPPQRSGYLDVAGYRALRAASWTAAGLDGRRGAAGAAERGRGAGPAGRRRARPRAAARSGAPAERGHRLDADRAGRGGRAGRLPDRADLGLERRAVRARAARPAAGGADRALGRRGSARPGHATAWSLHVLAASLWVGGLVGGARSPRPARGPDRAAALATAVPRFSRLALVCWLVLAVTGVVNAAGAHPARRAARLGVRRARAGQGGRAAGARRDRRRAPPVHGRRRPPAANRGRCCGSAASRCC